MTTCWARWYKRIPPGFVFVVRKNTCFLLFFFSQNRVDFLLDFLAYWAPEKMDLTRNRDVWLFTIFKFLDPLALANFALTSIEASILVREWMCLNGLDFSGLKATMTQKELCQVFDMKPREAQQLPFRVKKCRGMYR